MDGHVREEEVPARKDALSSVNWSRKRIGIPNIICMEMKTKI